MVHADGTPVIKGQIILPKLVRDAHHCDVGTEFFVELMGVGVLLRPVKAVAQSRLEDLSGCHRVTVPGRTVAEMDEAITAELRHRRDRGRYQRRCSAAHRRRSCSVSTCPTDFCDRVGLHSEDRVAGDGMRTSQPLPSADSLHLASSSMAQRFARLDRGLVRRAQVVAAHIPVFQP